MHLAMTMIPKSKGRSNDRYKRPSVAARQALTPMPKARAFNNNQQNRSRNAAREALTPMKASSVRSKANMYETASQREARASYTDQPSMIARRDSKSKLSQRDTFEERGYLPLKYSVNARASKSSINSDMNTSFQGSVDPSNYHTYDPPSNLLSRPQQSMRVHGKSNPPLPPPTRPKQEIRMAPLTQENLHKFLEGKSTSVARRVLGNPKAMVKNCPSSEQELQIKKEVENRASFAKFQKLVLMIEQTIVDHRSIEEQAFVNKFYNHFHKKKAHEPKVESATKTWEATSATANKPLSRLEL